MNKKYTISNELVIKSVITIISILAITMLKKVLNMEDIGVFYAAIASVVVANVEFKNLFKNSWERVLGTIIGGAIGITISYLNLNIFLTIIIGEILVIAICEKVLKIPSAIGSIVFLIIIYGIPSGDSYLYGIKRVLNTCLGVMVTLIIAIIGKKIKLFR